MMGVLAGVLVATNGDYPQRAVAAEFMPMPKVIQVIEVKLPDELIRAVSPVRNVSLAPPPAAWILRDETWKAMANSRFNIDVNLQHGHEYIGVRIVLPFGA